MAGLPPVKLLGPGCPYHHCSTPAMKALVYTAEREMMFREEPEPNPDAGDALIAIESVGICGSDMHAWMGHDPRRVPPLILGHEAVGTVLQGSNPGQRVVLNPLITCGKCEYCLGGRQNLCPERDLIGMYRPGAFAEQITIPERNLIPVPDELDSTLAALTEPGATALHAVHLAERTLSRPISETRTLVIGSGSVGLLTALILQDKGAISVEISETNRLRRETVRSQTDILVRNPLTHPLADDQYDLLFDAVGGSVTRESAIRVIKPGGTIVHIGLMDNLGGMDVRRMTLQEITFIGCYTYSPLDLQVTLSKIHQGAWGDLRWVETRPLAEGSAAFQDLHQGLCSSPKIVLAV